MSELGCAAGQRRREGGLVAGGRDGERGGGVGTPGTCAASRAGRVPPCPAAAATAAGGARRGGAR